MAAIAWASSVVVKAYKYRLYPSRPQQRQLEVTLETARRWYNDYLAQRRAAYELAGWSITTPISSARSRYTVLSIAQQARCLFA
jgi:hypothetical protein